MSISGIISGIVDTLEELQIDAGTIDEILKMLTEAQDELPLNEFGQVGKKAFGTLPAGKQMSIHTTGAQEFVLASLTEMAQTLGVYADGVRYFRQGTNRADEFSAEQMRHINEAIRHGNATNRSQDDGGDR
ncbi:hypothetical protein GCM10023340_15390 [Nocardioides marinquilinus]|uniref:Uncharacterized protein n=1 Tax=Nocardioides marinquilinus TaxID=1210400 RepID=A0ABP9PG66_9ACTN